jgi:hypothetical protein
MKRSPTAYWDDVIIDALNSGRLTILTGSAISMFGPTNLPTGSFAASRIKEILKNDFIQKVTPYSKKSKNLDRKIQELIKDIPFETVMELLAKATSLAEAKHFIHILVSTSKFNLVHKIFADWMAVSPPKEGPSLAIITTNYDLGIENAIGKTHPKMQYRRIVTRSKAIRSLGKDPILFKIHGSDSDSPRYQFVMTHDQETVLPQWKNEMLSQLVDNRVLLVVGYSGLDLDILPALSRNQKWAAIRAVRPLEGLNSKKPYGFEDAFFKIDEKMETLGTEGDLVEVLQRLWNINKKRTYKKMQKSVPAWSERVAEAMNILSDEQKSLWFALMIVGAGSWVLGCIALDFDGITGSKNIAQINAKAGILFYAGKYRAAADQWKALLSDPLLNLSLVDKVSACCSASGCLNCAGDLFGAWSMIIRAILFYLKMLFTEEREAVVYALGNILGRAIVAVPGASTLIKRFSIGKTVSKLIRRTGSFSMAVVLSQYSKPQKGALSLGCKASLVNEYRYLGTNALQQFEFGDLSARLNAKRWLQISLIWAKKLNDYAGLAKGWLGLWRYYVLIGDQEDALNCWRKGWQYANKVDYIGYRRFFAWGFASIAERYARVTIRSIDWYGTASSISYKVGKIATSLLSVG